VVRNGWSRPGAEKAQFRVGNRETWKVCPGPNRRIRKASTNWSKKETLLRPQLWRVLKKPTIKIRKKSILMRSVKTMFPMSIWTRISCHK